MKRLDIDEEAIISDEWVEAAEKVIHGQDWIPDGQEKLIKDSFVLSVARHFAAWYATGYQDRAKQDAERIEELERRVERWQQLQAKTESALNALKGNS